MEHRQTKKSRGGHTTLIPFAAEIHDHVFKVKSVTGISNGTIKQGIGIARGGRKVKFTDVNGGFSLGVRDNNSFQELKVYAGNVQYTRTEVARTLLDAGIRICFKK